jgi:hypothetical protein
MHLESQISAAADHVAGSEKESDNRSFLRRSLFFLLIGLVLYLGVYALSEQLIYRYAKRNRFFMVATAPTMPFDTVILGASHAAVFDYADMNARLEEKTGSKIINLSVVGGGITVNRMLLEYFLANHQTNTAIYFVDSFAFYSRDWNEDRLNDTRLFDRAPFDPRLAWIMLQDPASRFVALNYVIGFSKINNSDRFKPDITDDEATKFNTTYRPVKQIDEERIKYLYPTQIDPATFQHYLTEFEDLIRYTQTRHIRIIVIKPPVPQRVYNMLPSEGQFDQALHGLVSQYEVEFHDWSQVDNDDKFFFNTDHLNRTGVLNLFDRLVNVLPGSHLNR